MFTQLGTNVAVGDVDGKNDNQVAKLLDNEDSNKRKETSVNCISILGANGGTKAEKDEKKAAKRIGDNNKKRRKGRHQQKMNESSTSSKDTAAESDVENGAHRVSRLLGQNKPKR